MKVHLTIEAENENDMEVIKSFLTDIVSRTPSAKVDEVIAAETPHIEEGEVEKWTWKTIAQYLDTSIQTPVNWNKSTNGEFIRTEGRGQLFTSKSMLNAMRDKVRNSSFQRKPICPVN